jgi:GT2 family glycosyltransferase
MENNKIPSLCITTTNRIDCFSELVKSIDYPVKTLSVLVNSSSFEYLKEIRDLCSNNLVERFMVSHCPYNMGCSTGWNYHMKMNCDCDYWIIAGDDTVFFPGDLERMNESMKEYDYVGASESICLGVIFGVSKECVNKIGFFDENIHPINFEDNEWIARIEHHQVKMTRIPIRSGHLGSGTASAMSQETLQRLRGPIWDMNEEYYRKKILERGDFSEAKFDFDERRKKLIII